MKKTDMIEFAEGVVQEEIRKGNIIKNKDVLNLMPEVVNTVTIDRTKMREAVETCLSSKNPFNSLLNAFGIQIINKEKAVNKLVDTAVEESDVCFNFDNEHNCGLLSLNPEEYTKAIEKVAQKLSELESKTDNEYTEEKQRGDELFIKHEQLLKEHSELKQSAENNEKLIAQRIQYILSINSKEDVAVNEQLIELLRDINIEVYWDSNDTSFTNAAMFTEFAINDDSITGTKPCLVRDGSVYVKGVRFIKK